jgi:hypothetical protein
VDFRGSQSSDDAIARAWRVDARQLEDKGLHLGRQRGMHDVGTAFAERVAELLKGVIATVQHWSLLSCEKNADVFVEFQ